MKLLNNNIKSYVAYTTILTLTMGFPTFIFYAIGVLAPTLIQEFAIDKSIIGLLTMGTFACAAILSLWAGNIVKYLGAKKSLIVLFSCVFISFSLLIIFRSFYGMIVALLFCGISQSLANPITNLMIAQRVDDRFKSIIIGIKQSGIQLLALFAGLFIPFILQKYEWQFTFTLLLPILFILIILAPKMALSNDSSTPLTLEFIKPNKLLTLLMLTQSCVGVAVASFVTYLGLFAISLGISPLHIGLLISLYSLMGIISRVCFTTATNRIKDKTLLLPLLISATIIVFIILMFANPQRLWPIWVAALGMGTTAVVCNVIAISILLKDNRFGQPVNSSGLLSSGFYVGFTFGPILFGLVQLLPFGFYAGWFMLIIVLLLALSISIILYRTNKKEIYNID